MRRRALRLQARLRRRFATLHVSEARSFDGREWEVHVQRLRWPPWRSVSTPFLDDLDNWGFFYPVGALLLLPIALVTMVAIPLVIFLLEAPFAVFRSLRSRTRRVEAICRWPNEIRMEWETSDEHVQAVAREVAEQLELGYEHLAPANARFLGFTDPPAGPD